MPRSPQIVKAIHAIFFVVFNVLLAFFLYEVIADRITAVSVLALAMFLVEALVLVANKWQCPLTAYAERLGAASGRVTDIFLPRWIADRAYQIYGILFGVGIALLVLRVLV